MDNWIDHSESPIEVFKQWFEAAQGADLFEPTAMTLATVDTEGMPAARVVLLKDYGLEGFCFYTNYNSEKGNELAKNPKAALVFHWEKPWHRQIRIRGLVEKMSHQESNAYFQKRPRGSQIGAWASPQSQEIKNREELAERVQALEERFADAEIPCPENWGGYRLQALSIEFWQAQDHRLHDRIKFTRDNASSPWKTQRLAP